MLWERDRLDVRLWHVFTIQGENQPAPRISRGLFHRHAKGRWRWSEFVSGASQYGMTVWVEDARDAMTLRLYLPSHEYRPPNIPGEGDMDFVRSPAQVFKDGRWQDLTKEEVEEEWRRFERDLADEADQEDDYVQSFYERHGRRP
jgi:hypothetical protein